MARFCRCGCGVAIVGGRRDRKWATENCRKRFWDEANGRLCEGCGKTWLNARAVRSAQAAGRPGQCEACETEQRRWGGDRRVEIAAGMYEDGWPLREIAQVLYGAQSTSIPGMEIREARQRGLIGYRYAACAERAAA